MKPGLAETRARLRASWIPSWYSGWAHFWFTTLWSLALGIAAFSRVSDPSASELAIIPVGFLGGLTGQMYQQFAITIAVSVVISGIVALTLSPALCALMLKPTHGEPAAPFRWFNTFSIPLRSFGAMDLGVIYNYDSPLTFSYAAAVALSAQQIAARNGAGGGVGYKQTPSSTTVFFGPRGSGTFRSSQSLDLALTYSLPLFGSRIAPWVKAEMTNVTNRDALLA